MSATVSSDIEKEALKARNEMTASSLKLKADLKAILATEKERFAAQAAGLDAAQAAVAKTAGDAAKASEASSQAALANGKAIAELERKMTKLLNETVGLKKQYKIEMGKLIKELEG